MKHNVIIIDLVMGIQEFITLFSLLFKLDIFHKVHIKALHIKNSTDENYFNITEMHFSLA